MQPWASLVATRSQLKPTSPCSFTNYAIHWDNYPRIALAKWSGVQVRYSTYCTVQYVPRSAQEIRLPQNSRDVGRVTSYLFLSWLLVHEVYMCLCKPHSPPRTSNYFYAHNVYVPQRHSSMYSYPCSEVSEGHCVSALHRYQQRFFATCCDTVFAVAMSR